MRTRSSRDSHGGVTLALLVLAVLGAIVAGSGTVAAAGETDVRLSPAESTVDAGETTTVAVVVTDPTDGIGSFDVEVTVEDPAVANVTSASLSGSPDFGNTSYDSEREAVTLTASGATIQNDGPVTIANVTLGGVGDGPTSVELTLSAVGDVDGRSYEIADVHDAALSVEGRSNGNDGGPDGIPNTNKTATPTATATQTPSPTPEPAASDEPNVPTAEETTATTEATVTETTDSSSPTRTESTTIPPTDSPTATAAAETTRDGGGAVEPETPTSGSGESLPSPFAIGLGTVIVVAAAGLVYRLTT